MTVLPYIWGLVSPSGIACCLIKAQEKKTKLRKMKGGKKFWASLNQIQQISNPSKDWGVNTVILLVCVVYKGRAQIVYMCITKMLLKKGRA